MCQLIQTCQARDAVNLVKVTINKFFIKTKELTYETFVSMFNKEKDSLGWMISTKGIRSALEENDV